MSGDKTPPKEKKRPSVADLLREQLAEALERIMALEKALAGTRRENDKLRAALAAASPAKGASASRGVKSSTAARSLDAAAPTEKPRVRVKATPGGTA